MLAMHVSDLDLASIRSLEDPHVGCDVTFPIFAATGSAASAVVYFEVPVGGRLGRHTDSSEEIILILDGEAEADVNGERGRLSHGGLALIPAMVPHDVYNVGDTPVRVVGFFAGSTLVHRFFEPLVPGAAETVIVNGPEGQTILGASPVGAPAAV